MEIKVNSTYIDKHSGQVLKVTRIDFKNNDVYFKTLESCELKDSPDIYMDGEPLDWRSPLDYEIFKSWLKPIPAYDTPLWRIMNG